MHGKANHDFSIASETFIHVFAKISFRMEKVEKVLRNNSR